MKSGAFKIAGTYTIIGLLWIVLSDRVLDLARGSMSVSLILFISSVKGFVYVLLTGFILYRLIKSHHDSIGKSEKQYRSYFEANPAPMWIYNRRTLNFTAVNDAAIAKYGYTLEEFKNMTILDIRPKEDIGTVYSALKGIQSAHNDYGIWTHRKKDGTLMQVHITSHIITSGKEDHVMTMASEPAEPEKRLFVRQSGIVEVTE